MHMRRILEDKNCAESALTGYEYENRMLVLKKVVADLLRLTPPRVLGDGREWHSSEGMPSGRGTARDGAKGAVGTTKERTT